MTSNDNGTTLTHRISRCGLPFNLTRKSAGNYFQNDEDRYGFLERHDPSFFDIDIKLIPEGY